MKTADRLFLRYVPIESALSSYCFTEREDGFFFHTPVLSGDFELQVIICDKKVIARLIDTAYGDEYGRVDEEGEVGGFVASLKEECEKILIDLRTQCFKKVCFIHPQTNRICDKIVEKYHSLPEFLWDSDPDYGVFRNQATEKWFGIVMNVKWDRLVKEVAGTVEVINVKSDRVPELLTEKGIYPAYHMNKKHWVSVVLNDTIKDEILSELIEESYLLSK